MNIKDMEARADEVAGLLKSLSHPMRLMLLCQLVEGERAVGDLAAGLGRPQPAVSHQLGLLRREGLVQTRRAGQTVYYNLPAGPVSRLMEDLYRNFCS